MRLAENSSAWEGSRLSTLGLYLSVPFCRSKCTFCNFASDVYPESKLAAYVARLIEDLDLARAEADVSSLVLPRAVDSIYFGGGTPSILTPALLATLFEAIRRNFEVAAEAEITMEAAPGQLSDETLAAALDCGVNRFSFGVQSFVDQEAAATGRLHARAVSLADLARVRKAGAQASPDLNVDLIAGLPGQTAASWRESLDVLVDSGVNHASIYMLEVDEDSRLGSEMLLGGVRYGASAAPSDDATAAMYLEACERLGAAGLAQYEISNFARPGAGSRHNLKYWQRKPYLGVGLDASSMLRDQTGRAVRFSTTDDLDAYTDGPAAPELNRLDPAAEREEAWFLGLRTNLGVNRRALAAEFGPDAARAALVDELHADGLIMIEGDQVSLTERGRLISNDVFERFLEPEPVPAI
jgi:oxygen-independent coproporphyrinogen-3 oxidase